MSCDVLFCFFILKLLFIIIFGHFVEKVDSFPESKFGPNFEKWNNNKVATFMSDYAVNTFLSINEI